MAQLNEQDVLSALGKLSELKRDTYEPGLPEIGAILSLVEGERISRENRSTLKKSERLVRWECPECLVTLSGYPASSVEIANKRCTSKYKPFKRGSKNHEFLPFGQICGARLNVIHDDNEISDAGPMERWTAPWTDRSGAR